MSAGTWEWIHILGAGGHNVFFQLSTLYFLLDDCVCWLLEKYVWEPKKYLSTVFCLLWDKYKLLQEGKDCS